MTTTKSKGYTIIYYPLDNFNKPKVAGRFHTVEEKNQFLAEIYNIDSGWLPEELTTILVKEGYDYKVE